MRPISATLLLAFAGCSGISVTSDYDPKADFSKLRTYTWFSAPTTPDRLDTLTQQRILRAVDVELATRGYQKLDSGTPDFQVNAMASVTQRIEAVPTTASVGYGWGYGHMGYTTTELRTYDEGTLVLDIISPATKQLIWRGTARGAVEGDRTPEEREARIADAVARILAAFPPRQ